MSRRLIVALCTAIVCFFVVVLGIRVKGVRDAEKDSKGFEVENATAIDRHPLPEATVAIVEVKPRICVVFLDWLTSVTSERTDLAGVPEWQQSVLAAEDIPVQTEKGYE